MEVCVTGARTLPPSCVVSVDAGGIRRVYSSEELIDERPVYFPVQFSKDDAEPVPCKVEVLHPLSAGELELEDGISDYQIRVGGTIQCVAMLPKYLGLHIDEGLAAGSASKEPTRMSMSASSGVKTDPEELQKLKRQAEQAREEAKKWENKFKDANKENSEFKERLKKTEDELNQLRAVTNASRSGSGPVASASKDPTSIPKDLLGQLESIKDLCQKLSDPVSEDDRDIEKLQAKLLAQGKAIVSLSENLGGLRKTENECQALLVELENERSCMELLRQRNAELLQERQQLWEEAERHRHWVACQASADLGLLAAGKMDRASSRSPAKAFDFQAANVSTSPERGSSATNTPSVPPLGSLSGTRPLSSGAKSFGGQVGATSTFGVQPRASGSPSGRSRTNGQEARSGFDSSPEKLMNGRKAGEDGSRPESASPSGRSPQISGMMDQVNKLENLLQSLKNLEAKTPRTPRI